MINRNKISRKGFRILFISLLSLTMSVAKANELHDPNVPILPDKFNINQPAISIIVDDMGYRLNSGNRAVNLPGDITYSFLPHAPHVEPLSQRVHELNKEIMLHIPMESMAGKRLGPGGLTECMTEQDFVKVLESNIASVPYATGFNNHMGSLLTKSQLWMTRLMRKVVSDKKLFFVDSKTTSESVALKVARSEGLKSIKRDIFIDHEETEEFIKKQLRKLIRKAKRSGTALGIAHPKKITLSILEKWIPELEEKGIRLVPVSKLISLQQQRKIVAWKQTNITTPRAKN